MRTSVAAESLCSRFFMSLCVMDLFCSCSVNCIFPGSLRSLSDDSNPVVIEHYTYLLRFISRDLSHLCSRFLHLSQSEWSTPGSCHILHSGSSSYAMAMGRKIIFDFTPTVAAFVLTPPYIVRLRYSAETKLVGSKRLCL